MPNFGPTGGTFIFAVFRERWGLGGLCACIEFEVDPRSKTETLHEVRVFTEAEMNHMCRDQMNVATTAEVKRVFRSFLDLLICVLNHGSSAF
jgi:hypothetical protein